MLRVGLCVSFRASSSYLRAHATSAATHTHTHTHTPSQYIHSEHLVRAPVWQVREQNLRQTENKVGKVLGEDMRQLWQVETLERQLYSDV
jgi:uncharacterized protein YhbP (UPF0306 family)